MYALINTFAEPERLISRHRTPEAAGRAAAAHARDIKRANGASSYIPTAIRREDGLTLTEAEIDRICKGKTERAARGRLYDALERRGVTVSIRALHALAAAGYTPRRLQRATEAALRALPGIGVTLARRIAGGARGR